jgi:hypothetical protein
VGTVLFCEHDSHDPLQHVINANSINMEISNSREIQLCAEGATGALKGTITYRIEICITPNFLKTYWNIVKEDCTS